MVAHLHLMEFDFEVKHRPISHNKAPEALSRLQATGSDTRPVEYDIPVLHMQPQDTIMTFTDTTDIIQLPETTNDTPPTTDMVLLTDSLDFHYPVSQDELINDQTADPK